MPHAAVSPAGNSRHIQSIISLAAALRSALQTSEVTGAHKAQHAQQAQQSQHTPQQVQTVNDFLFRTQLDGINMFKLVRSAAFQPANLLQPASMPRKPCVACAMLITALQQVFRDSSLKPAGSFMTAL